MSKMITLTLPSDIVDEIINNLYDGVEVWRDTEEYLASKSVVAPCVIAECSSARKARRMLKLYQEAISVIEEVRSKR